MLHIILRGIDIYVYWLYKNVLNASYQLLLKSSHNTGCAARPFMTSSASTLIFDHRKYIEIANIQTNIDENIQLIVNSLSGNYNAESSARISEFRLIKKIDGLCCKPFPWLARITLSAWRFFALCVIRLDIPIRHGYFVFRVVLPTP